METAVFTYDYYLQMNMYIIYNNTGLIQPRVWSRLGAQQGEVWSCRWSMVGNSQQRDILHRQDTGNHYRQAWTPCQLETAIQVRGLSPERGVHVHCSTGPYH